MNNNDIRFAFLGTPEIAVTALDILESHGLVPQLVITRPDKPSGRGNILTPSPVKVWATAHNIQVLQPAKINDEFLEEVRKSEWDVFVLVAYGALLPQAFIDIPKRGILNMHPSLLPHLRGPSPIMSAILTDEHPNGVSVMLVDAALDHGPVIAQQTIEIAPADWPLPASVLESKLANTGGELLAKVLPKWVAGEMEANVQDESQVSFCKKINKEDGLISLSGNAEENLRKIRAFEGWPGTYTFFERSGKRIRVAILTAHIDSGKLAVDRVKPEGKNEMEYADFLRGGATPAAD